MSAVTWTHIEKWVGMTLIVSFALSVVALVLALTLRALDLAEPMLSSLMLMVALVAMVVTLVSALAWRVVCAVSWIRWFARNKTKRG